MKSPENEAIVKRAVQIFQMYPSLPNTPLDRKVALLELVSVLIELENAYSEEAEQNAEIRQRLQAEYKAVHMVYISKRHHFALYKVTKKKNAVRES